MGTASTWFLIDVTFYGQSLMNTTVVYNSVAATTGLNPIDKLRQALLGTVYVMLIALPGYWFAIAFVDRMGRYWMTQMGFLMSAIWFSVLAGAYSTPLRTSAQGGVSASAGCAGSCAAHWDRTRCLLSFHASLHPRTRTQGFVFIYGLTYFFANFGPNSTTFLMPVECYPTRVRSTAQGISAAIGKLGAITGSMGLLAMWYSYCSLQVDSTGASNCTAASAPNAAQQSQSDNGVVAVMALCAGISFMGNIMTTFFIKETGGKTLEQVDDECKTLKAIDAALDASKKELVAAMTKKNLDAAAADSEAATDSQAEAPAVSVIEVKQ